MCRSVGCNCVSEGKEYKQLDIGLIVRRGSSKGRTNRSSIGERSVYFIQPALSLLFRELKTAQHMNDRTEYDSLKLLMK